MGSLQAQEMASRLPLDEALEWHLRYNHYPPLSFAFVPIAKQAIELANEAIADDDDSKLDTELRLPDGIEDARTGKSTMTVRRVVESLHLDAWIE